MKNQLLKSTLAVTCFLFSLSLSAQEPTAKKYDNPQWKRVVFVDYHSGKTGRALEIIDDHFKAASKKAGTPNPTRLVMETGDYDLLLIWNMEGGIEDMNWETSPNSIKWRTALNEIMGGKDKADALMEEYRSLIRSAKGDLAMER